MNKKTETAISILSDEIAERILLLDAFSKNEISSLVETLIKSKYSIVIDSFKHIAQMRYERAIKEQHRYAGKDHSV